MLGSLRCTSLFLALPLLVLARPAAQEGTTLKWHFSAGEVLRYRVLMEQQNEMSLMPDQVLETDMGMVLVQTVREVAADGSASMDVGYEAIRMDVDSGPVQIHFDSTAPAHTRAAEDKQFADMLEPLLEAKFQIKMDTSGRVSGISGVKELLAKLKESLPSGGAPGVAEMFGQLFSEDSIRKMVEVNVFPDKPLAVGDTWKRSLEIPAPMLGTMKFSMENTFEGCEQHAGQPCAKIAVLTTIEVEKSATTQTPLKLDVTIEDSKGKTTQWFGTQAGHLIETAMTMEMNMKMKSPARDGEPGQGISMDMSSNISMRMLLLAKDDPAFEPPPAKPAEGKK